jgi:hypothetical protein
MDTNVFGWMGAVVGTRPRGIRVHWCSFVVETRIARIARILLQERTEGTEKRSVQEIDGRKMNQEQQSGD